MELTIHDSIDHQFMLITDLDLPEIDVLDCLVRLSRTFGDSKDILNMVKYREWRYFEIHGHSYENDFGGEK